MASASKNDELEGFRQTLLSLRARLRGDLDQMTDEALKRNQPDSSGNLSNVPLHMADVGTENYDQEFTLSLIENEQETLDQIQEALGRIDKGTYGRCLECGSPIAKPRLQALPYTRYCIECARKLESRESAAQG
ncbi:MAG TPA: TraR/DksA family transcriptional regulator [Isosphaeraceae bacterium]|jgi:RNA polymerase-binding protein DksA|nr:TraR/DksA family transcriptional regulator [Isosphaeraceae bacterium]